MQCEIARVNATLQTGLRFENADLIKTAPSSLYLSTISCDNSKDDISKKRIIFNDDDSKTDF